MVLPLPLLKSLFESPYNETHISGLFSPCTTSIFKNSPSLSETEPNSMERKSKDSAYTDSQCGFCGCVALSEPSNYSFALTSMSFRNLPLLYDMIGGFLKIVFHSSVSEVKK